MRLLPLCLLVVLSACSIVRESVSLPPDVEAEVRRFVAVPCVDALVAEIRRNRYVLLDVPLSVEDYVDMDDYLEALSERIVRAELLHDAGDTRQQLVDGIVISHLEIAGYDLSLMSLSSRQANYVQMRAMCISRETGSL